MLKLFDVTASALIFLLFWSHNARADENNKPMINVRSLGMGGVLALAAEDSSEMVKNPASLGLLSGIDLRYNLSQGAISSGFHLGKLENLGLTALDLSYEDRFLVEERFNPVGGFLLDDNQLLLSYGRMLDPRISLGGSLTYRKLKYGSGKIGYDLGVLVKPASYLSLGGSVTDILDTEIYKDNQLVTSFPQETAIGAAFYPWKFLNLAGSVDYPGWKLHLGTEAGMKGFYIRTGAVSSSRDTGTKFNWTAGLSLEMDPVEINYAYVSDPDLEHKHIVSIALGLVKKRRLSRAASLGQLVQEMAEQYGVELPLILALIKAESNFKPDAVSSVGAAGLMQLMPGTARDMGLKVPEYKDETKPDANPKIDERFDPAKNVCAGVKYLSFMLSKYNGNYVLTLAAYNAGPARVVSDVPGIRETERYTVKVLNYYFQYKNSPQTLEEDLQGGLRVSEFKGSRDP